MGRKLLVALVVLACLARPVTETAACPGATERVSVASDGTQANGWSEIELAISADARFVAFVSAASNLVSDDINGVYDIFVHDRQTGTTERVSVSTAGTQSNSQSRYPAISADGRLVVFESPASNLVSDDTNGVSDIFVHDRVTGGTSRVSISSEGVQADTYSYDPAITPDGRFVAFSSFAGNLAPGAGDPWGLDSRDVFVHDLVTGVTTLESVSSQGVKGISYTCCGSDSPAISGDGRYVAFDSAATNLVPGDTNNADDVFVHDRQTGTTERVSVGSAGVQGNSGSVLTAITGDGRYVSFFSFASNLVSGDTNSVGDAFVHDRLTGLTERVSVATDGTQGNGYSAGSAITADGRYVAFMSLASNLVPGDTNGAWDVFVHDRQTGLTQRVSVDGSGNQGNGNSEDMAISADGRYVAFVSNASNLVPADTNSNGDIFVHDRQTGATERVSVDSAGNQGNGASDWPAISADGHHVAFRSIASNLVPADTNTNEDIFVHDRQTGATERVSVDSAGNQANNYCWWHAAISADGRYVAFQSVASNLVPADTNSNDDIFVHDRQTGATERVSVDSAGNQGNGGSGWPAISADGRYVAFESSSSNLVPGDTWGWPDIFVHDRQTGATERVSVDSAGNQANWASDWPAISANGRYVALQSIASNLVSADTNGWPDIFVHDRGPVAVGGIAELPDIGREAAGEASAPAEESGSSAPTYAALAGALATAVAAVTAGAWYARRRWHNT